MYSKNSSNIFSFFALKPIVKYMLLDSLFHMHEVFVTYQAPCTYDSGHLCTFFLAWNKNFCAIWILLKFLQYMTTLLSTCRERYLSILHILVTSMVAIVAHLHSISVLDNIVVCYFLLLHVVTTLNTSKLTIEKTIGQDCICVTKHCQLNICKSKGALT